MAAMAAGLAAFGAFTSFFLNLFRAYSEADFAEKGSACKGSWRTRKPSASTRRRTSSWWSPGSGPRGTGTRGSGSMGSSSWRTPGRGCACGVPLGTALRDRVAHRGGEAPYHPAVRVPGRPAPLARVVDTRGGRRGDQPLLGAPQSPPEPARIRPAVRAGDLPAAPLPAPSYGPSAPPPTRGAQHSAARGGGSGPAARAFFPRVIDIS